MLTKVSLSFTEFHSLILNGATVAASLEVCSVCMLCLENGDSKDLQNVSNVAYTSAVPPPRNGAHISTELPWKPEIFYKQMFGRRWSYGLFEDNYHGTCQIRLVKALF
jgi:hypothetical protein